MRIQHAADDAAFPRSVPAAKAQSSPNSSDTVDGDCHPREPTAPLRDVGSDPAGQGEIVLGNFGESIGGGTEGWDASKFAALPPSTCRIFGDCIGGGGVGSIACKTVGGAGGGKAKPCALY